jgi:tRNA 5-methylaminomethyl-2-thiouridine biosynthesis bifunctional protein
MKRNNTPWRTRAYADINWSQEQTPISSQFGDVYFSRDDGLAESRYVFLEGNRLPERWQQHNSNVFTVAETGFGTGLNFLLTWQAWDRLGRERPRLHFISVEKHPLTPDDLIRALSRWGDLTPYAEALLAQYPLPIPGNHRLLFASGQVVLDLWFEDAIDWAEDFAPRGNTWVDAWYLDGFAPARNADLWSPRLLQAMGRLSHTATTLATFTAAGQVRRDLESAGFSMHKATGFGRKRECLRGTFAGSQERAESGDAAKTALHKTAPPLQSAADITPWDLARTQQETPKTVLVLGAGLAGCTAAYALATRGIPVQLLDQGQVASAASGNQQGVLYTRFSHKHSPLTDFALQSYAFAHRWYHTLFASGQLKELEDGALCGCFQQMPATENLAKLADALQSIPGLARLTSAEEASAVLGVRPAHAGLWLPDSGWINPAALCRALIAHPLICLQENCGELALAYRDSQWTASNASHTFTAPCAIVATGCDATQLAPLHWLPTRAIRGQTTLLPASTATRTLRAVLCHEGYIAPTRSESHCIGATFSTTDRDREVRTDDHRQNLDSLGEAVPQWKRALDSLHIEDLGGRTGFRCASPDYLPLTGPVPDLDPFLQTFAALRDNARQQIPEFGHYMPGLYLSTGHGSRGLTSTPLCAELLASAICAEASPLSRELSRALAPARFLIRDLARGRR